MNENGYYIPPEDEEPKATEAKEPEAEASEEAKATEERVAPPAPVFETPIPTAAPAPQYDRVSVITRACSSGLFLAICILTLIYTVICGLPSISFNMIDGVSSFNSQVNIPLLPLLVTIGLWIVYNAACKGEFAASGTKLVSGSLKAIRIVTWIVAILLLVCSVLMILGGVGLNMAGINSESLISYSEEDLEELREILDELRLYFPDSVVDGIENIFTDDLLMSIFVIVMGAVFGIIGIVMILINIFFYGYLYKFARSLREWGEGEGESICAVRGAANWLIVMAVFSCIGAMSFSVTSGLLAAIYIVTSVIIKRYFYDYAE